jgi:lysophospholipase L1-like esterase
MPLPRKTLTALGAFVALIVVFRWLPYLEWFRSPGVEVIARIVAVPIPRFPKPAPAVIQAPPRPVIARKKKKAVVPAVVFPPGPYTIVDRYHSMTGFYEALERCERKEPGAIVRVLHYGDSPTTADLVTGDVRQLLQKRYGNAGHGFVLISKPWAWYGHRGVTIEGQGWQNEAASQLSRAPDNIHGLGGVTSIGAEGATATLTFADGGNRRFEVQYLSQPGAGDFVITSEGRQLGSYSTSAPDSEPGFAEAVLPLGASSAEITVTRGKVRLFGVWAEHDEPGVIYASLGLNGASAQTALHYFEPRQWEEQMRHQHPNLIVINYGSNESDFPDYVGSMYASELRRLVERVKRLAPKSSILIMSPMDRGMRESSGELVTVPALPRIVEIQQQVAESAGVAFFNTYMAMGGPGTMARWYTGKPRLVSADFLHPMPAGAAEVAALFEQALVDGYEQWKAGE